MTPKREIEKLRKELERHNRLYYEGAPEISDYDFDQMLRRLQALEAEHPELFDPNSPSQRGHMMLVPTFLRGTESDVRQFGHSVLMGTRWQTPQTESSARTAPK